MIHISDWHVIMQIAQCNLNNLIVKVLLQSEEAMDSESECVSCKFLHLFPIGIVDSMFDMENWNYGI